jgi:CBS domain-containing protein
MNAADIMTTRLATAAPDTALAELVHLMVDRHVRAVPILEAGKLVGIVTQTDIIRALASRDGAMAALSDPDRRIREAFNAALARPPWSDAASNPTCIVDAGVVNLWGIIDTETDRQALLALARSLPGVRAVEDHMRVQSNIDPFDRPNWPVPAPP